MRLCALACFLTLVGCLPEEATDPVFRRDLDAAVDAAVDAAPDAAPDLGPDAAPVACTWPSDCPEGDCVEGVCRFEQPIQCLFFEACGEGGTCPDGQVCTDGTCQQPCPEGEVCGGFARSFWCYRPCELERTCPLRSHPCEGNVECGRGSVCVEGRCINACEHDGQCAEDGFCFEGECRRFPSELFNGTAPTPLGQPGQLVAGVGVVPMKYPLGVEMAGYGARPGPRNPYAVTLGGSDRFFERQDVRVVVLSTDKDLVILLRLPLCWSTDDMLARTALKVQAATGVNYLNKIITFGTHSHSQPGRFWNLVPDTGFGIFGHGQFSPALQEGYTDAFAAAIVAALADVRPARVGWSVVDDFDPQRRIHSNRRGGGPDILDDRMMVMRVEELDGTPRAGLVQFAMHGTHMEETWITGDAPGGVEVIATQNLSKEAGRFVPVLFANGNAGNVSPRGDNVTRLPWGTMQVIGHRVWPIFRAAWEAATPEHDLPLEVVQRRVPMSYSLLGYDINVPEFRANDGTPQEYGAFQCVAQERNGDQPDHEDGRLGCLLNLQAFLGKPTVQLHKLTLAAFKLGDLVVTTLPGEPTSQLGLELSTRLEAEAATAGQPNVRVVNFGYSQDHHLYLVLEDDWFRGGYEAAQSLWGWRLGRYVLENSFLLGAQLFTAEQEDNTTPIKPTLWPDLQDDTVMPTPGDQPAGEVVIDLPPVQRRGDMFEMRWIGGHPGVDQPDVVMQVQGEDGTFTDGVHNGLRTDHIGFETLTFYLGDFAGSHVWAIRWELPFDHPLGTWRVHVAGRAVEGEYTVASAPFAIQPATLVARGVGVAAGRLSAQINYPDGPTNDDGATAFEALEAQGHLLRIDGLASFGGDLETYSFLLGPAVPTEGLTTLQGGVRVESSAAADVLTRTLVTARSAEGVETTQELPGWPTTRIETAAPARGQMVRVVDAWGNAVEIATP
jgi:hypothetical protein